MDLFSTIGQVFDPSLYYQIEEGFSSAKEHRGHNRKCDIIEDAEYSDYSFDDLCQEVQKAVSRAEEGEEVTVDMGISVLTGRVVVDKDLSDPGDRWTAPVYDCTYRLEGVCIIEESGKRRRDEEKMIEKIIF